MPNEMRKEEGEREREKQKERKERRRKNEGQKRKQPKAEGMKTGAVSDRLTKHRQNFLDTFRERERDERGMFAERVLD